MTDWGAHHFDITQWGLGMDGSGPVKIEPPNINEDGLLTYTYENGTKVVHQGGGNGVLFIGTEGEIEVNRGHLRSRLGMKISQRARPRCIGATTTTVIFSSV